MTQDSSINNVNITLNDKNKKQLFTKAMLHNTSENIKDNKKLMIVLLILHLLAAPTIIIAEMIYILTTGMSGETEAYCIIGSCTTIIAAAAGILCALSVFKYLYKKSAVDMSYSLPMTTKQRFISDFISGLFVYTAPFIAAQLCTGIAWLTAHLLCDGKNFSALTGGIDNITGQPEYYTWKCTIFSEAAPLLWRGIIGGLMLMIMFYAVTVLVTSCCGRLFECVAYNILANVLVPLLSYVAIYAVTSNITGLNSEYYYERIISFCFPLGGVFGLILSLNNTYENISMTALSPITFGKWFIVFTLITVAICIAAYFVYKKRKAEDTGKPIVFSFFYHTVMTLGVICLTYMFMCDGIMPEIVLPMFIVTTCIYCVLHVIKNNGFTKIFKGIGVCLITICLSLGSFLLVHETKAFGAGEYVPNENNVSKVYITYPGLYNTRGANYYGNVFYNYSLYDGITACIENSDISYVTQAHSSMVNEFAYEENATLIANGDINIIYKMKSGRTVVRHYSLTNDALLILSNLDCTETMRNLRADYTVKRIREVENILKVREDNDPTFRRNTTTAELMPQWVCSYGNKYYDNRITIAYNDLPSDFITTLAEHVYNDIMNEPEEEYFTPKGRIFQLYVFSGTSITIKESYTETMAYLNTCGFDTLPEISEGIVQAYRNMNFTISMSSIPLLEYITGEDAISSTNSSYGDGSYIYNNSYESIPYRLKISSQNNSDVFELLKVSRKQYKTDESCYTIIVDGNVAVIPSEYSELAEKVFIKLNIDSCILSLSTNEYSTADYYIDLAQYNNYYKKFIEFYGEEKIINVLEEYYDGDAEEIFNAFCEGINSSI
ncbi:MAG: hypothetical protein IJ368_08935 [Oscillospiraceae bacterium]|nr:hypothetical protein [Oscillospiraceae bacterium]